MTTNEKGTVIHGPLFALRELEQLQKFGVVQSSADVADAGSRIGKPHESTARCLAVVSITPVSPLNQTFSRQR